MDPTQDQTGQTPVVTPPAPIVGSDQTGQTTTDTPPVKPEEPVITPSTETPEEKPAEPAAPEEPKTDTSGGVIPPATV